MDYRNSERDDFYEVIQYLDFLNMLIILNRI